MKRVSCLLTATLLLAGCGNSGTESQQAGTPSAAPAVAQPAPATTVPQVSYEQLMLTAGEQIKQRSFNEAVKTLTQAITQNPTAVDAYLKRAAICSEANLHAQAIADMTSAIKLSPENAKYLNTRGYFLLLSKQYDRADRDFSDAIGLDLKYPQPYNNRGLVAVAQGDFERAVKDFDNAIRNKPDYLDAHNNRGFALLQLDQLEPALVSFSRVLELDPNYINAITNRAQAEMKLKRYAEAIADFSKAIELQADNTAHYSARADAYLAAGNQESAAKDMAYIHWLQKLTELNQRIARAPQDASAWASRGQHLLVEGRHPEAKKSFENALKLVPNHSDALNGRAQLALANKDYTAAINDCTESLKQDPRYETLSLRGDAYFALEKFGEAIADYETARRFDEHVAEAYRRRAASLRANGDAELAKADEQMASKLLQQLTDKAALTAGVKQAAPREVVIEQTSYEVPAPVAPRELK